MQRDAWERVHGELTRLARSKGAYDAEEARWLLEGKRVRVHEPLGYGSFFSYLEHVFGYGPRMAGERLRVAETLVGLPAMNDALASGELCWSAVRELTRVAVPATEAEWIAAAQGKSMREVEDMVSGRRPGARPGDAADMGAKRHVLRLEISGDTLAAFREARRRLELDVGHSLDDDEAIRMLAHYTLGGPTDTGRAAYQVAMTLCEQCGRGTRDGAGRELDVEQAEIEAACCDAQHIGNAHVGGEPGKATQTIPPRIRRLVYRRAHGRCEVPGCRAARFLEIHHIVPRAAGGTHDPARLVLLCSAHHLQVHRRALRVSGTAPDHLEFRRLREVRPASASASPPPRATSEPAPACASPPPGTTPGPTPACASPPPRATPAAASDLHADALDGLRRLGFSAAEARRALAAASGGDIETLLREALSHLRPRVHVSCASEPTPRYGSRLRCAASSSRTSDRECAASWSSARAPSGRTVAARSLSASRAVG